MSRNPPLLVLDARPAEDRRGLAEAIATRDGARPALSLVAALVVAARDQPELAIVHAGLDATSERRPGGVIAAAEIARRVPGVSLVLTGAPQELTGWSLLHELGATARFVPDQTTADEWTRLLDALAEERQSRKHLARLLSRVAPAPREQLAGTTLGRAAAALEQRLILAAAQQAKSRHEAARLLSLREGGLQARLRKLGLTLETPAPTRSTRERLLVVGTGSFSQAFCKALSEADVAIVQLPPGVVHAGAEARGGARAAVIEVEGVDAVVDAWALRRVAPAIPIVLHGRGAADARVLLETLTGLPDVLSSAALASERAAVAEGLLRLGHASFAVDACCRSLGGAGVGPTSPEPLRLSDVTWRFRLALCDAALAQEPTLEKAAELLAISPRALQRTRAATHRASRPG